jgi:hypothetical protein
MANVVFISCANKKSKQKNKAKYLYKSDLFKKSLEYAERILRPDKIFILSAKHGLLALDEEIEPYDEALKDKNREEQRQWAKLVFNKINKECDVNNDTFIILAGKMYYKDLINYLPNIKLPMNNLKIGYKKQWLKKELYG